MFYYILGQRFLNRCVAFVRTVCSYDMGKFGGQITPYQESENLTFVQVFSKVTKTKSLTNIIWNCGEEEPLIF